MRAQCNYVGRVLRLLVSNALLLLLPGGTLLAHGGYHERIEYLTAAVTTDPSDPRVHFELANLHGQHGDLQLSLRELDRVDALAPQQFLTDLSRGEALFLAGKFAEAKEALDREIGSHPECARAYLLRARVEERLGHEAISLANYRQALQFTLAPDPDLVQEVATALATHDGEQEAAQVLATGIEKLGRVPALVLRAIDLEIASQHFDRALQLIEECRLTAPRPEPWMARRAGVLAQAGQMEESRAAWEALARHLDSLPDQERKSYGMTKLREEAAQALASAKSLPAREALRAGNPSPLGVAQQRR